jgi:hypothetical protein
MGEEEGNSFHPRKFEGINESGRARRGKRNISLFFIFVSAESEL